MALKEKTITTRDGGILTLTPEWINSKLGEVYELSHLDKIDQERLHYGYMTEALVSFLETTDEKGVPFFERVELKSIDVGNNRICNLLNQKVILDKPSKIERENFYHDFKLWPTIYSDEKKIDDIVVKVHSEFTLCNREGDLELLKDSIANYNTQLSGYSKVDSCYFEGAITKDAKDGAKELIGYNGAASTFVDEPKKDAGKITEDLEIL